MQVKICIVRGFQRLRGEMAFTLITIFANLLISLVLGSIFYDLPDSVASFYSRGALLFVTVLFNALTSALEVGFGPCDIRQNTNSLGPAALCHTPSDRKARLFCILPPRFGCDRLDGDRTSLQDHLRDCVQCAALLYGQLETRSRTILCLLPVRFQLHFDDVHDISVDGTGDSDDFTSSSADDRLHLDAHYLHWICSANQEYAGLASVAQLSQPHRLRF